MFPNFVLLFLLNTHNEVLLLRRINTPFCNEHYCLPGGKIESGESASQAFIREIKDSISISCSFNDIKCIHIMHRKCNEPEFFACVFTIESWTGYPHIMEEERYDKIEWFALDKLPEKMVPAHRYAIEMIVQKVFFSEHGWKSL